jgi:hypothetical protein
MEDLMSMHVDRKAIDRAIDRSLYCAFHGQRHAAREWAAEAVRLMEVREILLMQYRWHAAPASSAKELQDA